MLGQRPELLNIGALINFAEGRLQVKALFYREMVVGHQTNGCGEVKVLGHNPGPEISVKVQAAEMLSGAAGSLVGIGSA